MEQKKKELQKIYKAEEAKVKQMDRELDKLNQYLNPEQSTVTDQKRRQEPSH